MTTNKSWEEKLRQLWHVRSVNMAQEVTDYSKVEGMIADWWIDKAKEVEKEEWEDDWRWIVYIQVPTGQVSWHIHDSEIEMFDHLEVKENNWDGHNTERKYQRLSKLQALKEKKTIKTGYIGELSGYRIHGKTFDTEGNEIEETHEKDCFCCRRNLLGNKGEEIK